VASYKLAIEPRIYVDIIAFVMAYSRRMNQIDKKIRREINYCPKHHHDDKERHIVMGGAYVRECEMIAD